MKRLSPFVWLFAILSLPSLSAQPGYTADDLVVPYTGQFRTGMNMGYFQGWDNYKLADIAAGNPAVSQPGVGARTLRFSAPEDILDFYGYDLFKTEIAHYSSLNTAEHTALIWKPKGAHQDLNEYCPGHPSALFANMYLPIWDGGANGTPYNDNNYLAAYVYKTVSTYKDDIKFWEIWNEPGLDLRWDIGGIGWRDQSYPGNWWAEGPNPCDYILRAPIYHYIRTLRICWEVIKTVDPDAYVCLGSVGYQSLLNAICSNTDNPNNGDVTAAYPKTGGAYFDAVTFHSYPHFDGATTNYNAQFFERHSDQAADGVITYRQLYQQILDQYGYNGVNKPRKEWIITEINSPRKVFGLAFNGAPQLGPFFGGVDAQINHIMKALMVSKVSGIHVTHIYELFDRKTEATAGYEFDLMGMYKTLNGAQPYNITINDEGIAVKTTSDFIHNTTYDPIRTAQMNLPSSLRGYAFKRQNGTYIYAIWARTTEDLSEAASGIYSFPASFGLTSVEKYDWNYGYTGQSNIISSQNISLSARPVFFTAPGSVQPCAIAASVNELACNNNGTPTIPADDTYSFVLTVNNGSAGTWNTSVNGTSISGTYGTPVTVGPIAISSGAITIVVRDAVNNLCSNSVTVTPPPTCSNQTDCQITATVTNKLCNNNGTPTDPSDDTFTFRVSLSPTGTTCGNGWYGANTTSTYGTQVTLGPFAIANGPVYLAFQDNANTTIGTNIIVTPPPTCSNQTDCQISATVINKLCNNNGTPSDPSDDTFTFQVSLSPTGTTCGNGWLGANTASIYGTFVTLGPYAIANGPVTIAFQDNANAAISTNITVTPPPTCSNVPVNCDASSVSALREWIAGVSVGNMTNVTSRSTYTDYSATKVADLTVGASAPITLTTGYTFFTFNQYFRVWIDFNKNGVYEASERVFEGINPFPPNGTPTKSISGSIQIPANAPTGATRMRIAMSRSGYPEPCQVFARGEVEDYGVNISLFAADQSKERSSVEEINVSQLVALYPNPSRGRVVVDLRDWLNHGDMDAEVAFLQVYDQLGVLVHSQEHQITGNTFAELDLTKLPSGLYQLRISAEGHEVATKRLQISGK